MGGGFYEFVFFIRFLGDYYVLYNIGIIELENKLVRRLWLWFRKEMIRVLNW